MEPRRVSLRQVHVEIEKVEDAVRQGGLPEADEKQLAQILNALEKLKKDVKVLCSPEGADEPTFDRFNPPFGSQNP
jgi:hypothetical protein